MTKDFQKLLVEARQFALSRTRNLEIEEQRTFNLEPRILDDWSYYIARTWQLNKDIKKIDKFYMEDNKHLDN